MMFIKKFLAANPFIGRIIKLFILWRLLLFGASLAGELFIAFNPSFPYWEELLKSDYPNRFVWGWGNFDGVHYLSIAREGYARQFTQVFFPLFPFLLSLLVFLTRFNNYLIWGLIFSNLSFLIFLIVFYKLVRFDYPEKVARKVIYAVLFFPTSFFFAAIYPEGLFMLLVALAFYILRKYGVKYVFPFAFLASLLKIPGIFLSLGLVLEGFKNTRLNKGFSSFITNSGLFLLFLIRSPLFYFSLAGLAGYMIYLGIFHKDPLYFWHNQGVFGAQRASFGLIFLPQVYYRYLKILLSANPYDFTYWTAVIEVSLTSFTLLLLILGVFKKVRPSYLLFSFAVFFLPTLTGTLSSMPRYVLSCFAVFLVMALLPDRVFKVFLALGVLLLVLFTVLFTSGYFIG